MTSGGTRTGAGRPPKPPAQTRTKMLRVRLTEAELKAIEKQAARAGQTISEYARTLLLG